MGVLRSARKAEGGLREVEGMLRRYRLLTSEIEWLRMEVRACQAQEEELRQCSAGKSVDGMPSAKGGRADPTLRAVEMILDRSQVRVHALMGKIERLMAERQQMDKLMEQLEAEEQRVVRMRWLEGSGWVGVARKMFLCQRQCQRIHSRALEKMGKMLA